jgi:hypothetical protein
MDQEKACTACRKNLVPREKGPETAPPGEDAPSGADRELSNLDLIEQVCRTTALEDPLAIACTIMQRPQISLHGPEHHFLVPAVLIAAYYNHRGSPEKKDPALRQARKRAGAVQPAFCGTHGTCGAAIGTGIFMSLITHAGPLKKEEWSLSNQMTARSLTAIAVSGGPRCCKRDSWLAIGEAVKFLAEKCGISLPVTEHIACEYATINQDCTGYECPFYPEEETGA